MKELLNPHLFNFYELDEGASHTYPSRDYLTANRLDIIPRYIYARHSLLGHGRKWGEYVYREALRALNPSFREGDGRKKGFDDYCRQFDALIESYRKSGHDATTSLIPIADNSIVDGAHRVATALALNEDISVIGVSGPAHDYSANVYLQHNLSPHVLEAMVNEYIYLKPNVYSVVLFPVAHKKKKKARSILLNHANLVYEKMFTVSDLGKPNLLNLLYSHESWWNDRDDINLTNRFASPKSEVDVLFVEFHDGIDPTEVKQQIRKLYNIGNDPIHINDHHFEAKWLADAILNHNGLMHLNNHHPQKFEKYTALIEEYKNCLEKADNLDNFCVDSGSVLAQFGIRDTQDIDYISADGSVLEGGVSDINIHNDEYVYMPFDLDSLVYDPRFHFRYKGIKFLSIDTVEWFKKLRGEDKDFQDIDLIKQCVKTQTLFNNKAFIRKKKARSLLRRAAPAGVKLLKSILPHKAYAFIRNIYRKAV